MKHSFDHCDSPSHNSNTCYRCNQPETETYTCDFCDQPHPQSTFEMMHDGLRRCAACKALNAHLCMGPCESGTVIYGREELCNWCKQNDLDALEKELHPAGDHLVAPANPFGKEAQRETVNMMHNIFLQGGKR